MTNLRPRFQKALFRSGVSAVCLGALVACAHQAPASDPDSTERVGKAGEYLAARHAQATHDTALAAELYRRALIDDPDNPELLRRSFQLLTANGRIDDALPIAQRIVATTPNAALPNLLLLSEDMRAHRFNEALARAQGIPNDGLVSFVRPLAIAWAEAGIGDKAAAEAALKELSAKTGFGMFTAFHKALIDDLMGDQAGARAAYDAATAANKAQFVRITQADGSFYERSGDREAARRLYEAYEHAHGDTLVVKPALARVAAGGDAPRAVPSVEAGLAEAYFDIASLLHQERIDDVAVLLAQLSLRLRPDMSVAKLLVADIYEGQGHLESAIAVYAKIDRESPLSWSARLRAAVMLSESGRLDASVKQLEAMAAERPDRSDALIALGDVLRSSERFGDAVAAYDRAVARISHPDRRDWAVFYARGIALERSNQWPRAEADLLKAVELNPDQPYVLNYLAYSWVEHGTHLDRATKMLERALQLRPKDPQIIDSMGWALYHQGRFDGAVDHLEQAVELRPQDSVINDHLGDAYWRVGRYKEARFQWQRALNLDPEPDTVAGIESKIERGLKPVAKSPSGAALSAPAKPGANRRGS
jgi:tetratricopeptide (TPR) repeat protein